MQINTSAFHYLNENLLRESTEAEFPEWKPTIWSKQVELTIMKVSAKGHL